MAHASDDTPHPPPGFDYLGRLFADDARVRRQSPWLLFVWANLMALLPLGVLVLLLWLPYQLYLLAGAPLVLFAEPAWPTAVSIAVGAAMILASILIHELLHGAALLLLGCRPVISVQRGYMTASVRRGQFLARRGYLLMSLTPIVLMSLAGGGLLLLLPPAAGELLMIALLLNAAASIGDLFVAFQVFKTPPRALFTDARGIHVYLPADAGAHSADPASLSGIGG